MFIIAEVGSNHKSLADCLHSCEVAAECGADAVKFQMYTHKDMYGYGPDEDLNFKREWLPVVAEACHELDIEFMCTAFSVDGLKRVDPFVNYHKIASSDSMDPFMLDVSHETHKPVFVSVGGKTLQQIDKIVSEWMGSKEQLILMYCEASYPSNNVNPLKFSTMQDSGLKVGFSDHTILEYPVIECEYYEKHVNFCGYIDTPDAMHSLDKAQFKKYCDYIRGKWWWLGDGDKPMLHYHNKRLVVTEPVKAGDTFRFGVNYGIFRSKIRNQDPVSPMQWDVFDGKTCMEDLITGQPMSFKHIGNTL